MADRDLGLRILGWVGDVGEVVLAECFCDRVGVFRDALGVTGIWGENNDSITVTYVTSFWFFRIKISYNHCLSLSILNNHFSPTLLIGGKRVSNLGVTRVYT